MWDLSLQSQVYGCGSVVHGHKQYVYVSEARDSKSLRVGPMSPRYFAVGASGYCSSTQRLHILVVPFWDYIIGF